MYNISFSFSTSTFCSRCLGELAIAAVALDEGAKPAAGDGSSYKCVAWGYGFRGTPSAYRCFTSIRFSLPLYTYVFPFLKRARHVKFYYYSNSHDWHVYLFRCYNQHQPRENKASISIFARVMYAHPLASQRIWGSPVEPLSKAHVPTVQLFNPHSKVSKN